MQVLFNPGENIEGRESLAARVDEIVQDALGRFAGHITRVEVHVSDEAGTRSGPDDKRCMMEARIAGHPPLAVTHHAPTLREALGGAAQKLQRSVDHTLGKLERR